MLLSAPETFAKFNPLLPVQDGSSESGENLIKNGSFEEWDGEYAKDWSCLPIQSGFKLVADKENPLDGETCGLIDTTKVEGRQPFAILNQYPDLENLRGKRIRFRAAVRTAERKSGGRAQLWMREDLPDRRMGWFDNMDARPIKGDQWKHFEIVTDIHEDAKSLTIGMLVFKSSKAWIDDVSLEIVGDDIPTTSKDFSTRAPAPPPPKTKEEREERKKMMESFSQAATSPTQPFFNHWLWIVGIVLLLFGISQLRTSYVQRFALHFTFAYWILYCFPTVILGAARPLIGSLGKLGIDTEQASLWMGKAMSVHTEYKRKAVDWVNESLLGQAPINYLPSGSGDKTEDFVYLLFCFGAAIVVAIVWSIITFWRKVDQTWIRDLLRTYMRYYLAFMMLGYGLAKAGFITTQFTQTGEISDYALEKTFGQSSPMGLVWTFLAASPSYTFFAGLGEVTGAILLVFRRTATLGALMTFGVMLNVMMLNFCYDIPVKQFSFHLVVMALLIAAADFDRLGKVLLLNRPTEASNLLRPPFAKNKFAFWAHLVVKMIVVACAFAIPTYNHVHREVTHEHLEKTDRGHVLTDRGFRWVQEMPFNR